MSVWLNHTHVFVTVSHTCIYSALFAVGSASFFKKLSATKAQHSQSALSQAYRTVRAQSRPQQCRFLQRAARNQAFSIHILQRLQTFTFLRLTFLTQGRSHLSPLALKLRFVQSVTKWRSKPPKVSLQLTVDCRAADRASAFSSIKVWLNGQNGVSLLRLSLRFAYTFSELHV